MILYNIGIFLYALIVRIISPFHLKARKMIVGHKETYNILRKKVVPNARYIWFHAASLGEFEQGRPIIEKLKKTNPEYKILLTFFSPSGYDIRKDYSQADIVCYLPFDKKRNVKKFLSLIQPEIVIFIKYEFWYNFVNQLHKRSIPTYIVSAVFRPNQLFFRWYGKSMQKVLHMYKYLCVQDENSQTLLASIGVTNVKVCGDTRFDRVLDIRSQAKEIDLIEKFAEKAKEKSQPILVIGSSWPKDEDIYLPYFNSNPDLKIIIAPHEISEAHLKYIEENLQRSSVRYSQATPERVNLVDCIILDSIGMLSSVYRYGQMAYVGGGFGVGIHNVLEAAVYNIPVIFGPNFKKFIEAVGLIESGGGYSIAEYETFRALMDEFMEYPKTMETAGNHAGKFVSEHAGAVNKVMSILAL